MSKIQVPIELKDQKYPYIQDRQVNLTEIGDRQKGRIIYVSGRFVKSNGNENYVEFERVNEFTAKLENAKLVQTEKGTLILKFEPGSTLYLIELPSGFRGSVKTQVQNGNCIETVILRSPRGSIGEVVHLWCSNNAEISYQISGRTRTAGYGSLLKLFGENLSGKIKIENDNVQVIYDEELDKLLS